MDIWHAAEEYKKHKGPQPYKAYEHAAVSARSHPFAMQVPKTFIVWNANESCIIGFRRTDEVLAVCRCGLVLSGIYIELNNIASQIPVALKVMDKLQIALQRDDIENEVRVMSQLQMGGVESCSSNPYVLRWEYKEDEYNEYIATEYVSNGSLAMFAAKRIKTIMV